MIRKWTKPTLYGSGAFRHFLESRSKLVQEKYCPPLICLNPAMQFYVRTKYEKPPPIQIVKETLKLSDGGIVAFDHFANNKGSKDKDDYIVVISPGLRETTHSVKILTLANSLLVNGFPNVFVLNSRASCSIPMTSKMMTFAWGDGNHLNESVENLESRFPGKKIILVGACLGAMSTIDYLSTEEANRPSIAGAVLHSCNWELKADAMKCSSGINYQLFNKGLVIDTLHRIEKSYTEEERELKEEWYQEKGIDMEYLRKSKSIWDIEERFVAPLIGVSGADEYYQKVSPVNKCHKVKKPVVVINSRDDFMAPFDHYKLPEFVKNPNLVLWSTAAGGHVCFVDGLFPVTNYLDKAVPECAKLMCDFVEEGDDADK
ncbi:phospholipase ABHD3-like [Bolinopsis microptera]|uniref:phospholipase ABHD3-like n=1 Tax=Bolinopsis microptera TaxID=2820187 RepID=UPI00307A456D